MREQSVADSSFAERPHPYAQRVKGHLHLAYSAPARQSLGHLGSAYRNALAWIGSVAKDLVSSRLRRRTARVPPPLALVIDNSNVDETR